MNASGSAALHRTLAILLAAVPACMILTDWIIAPWAAALGFAVVFAAAGVTALAALRRNIEIRFAWILVPLLAIVLVGLSQLALGVPRYRFPAWWAILSWTAALALVWSGLQAFSEPGATRAFRTTAIAFGTLLGFEAVLQSFSSAPYKIYGLVSMANYLPMGPFPNRDHYCALMELLLPFALWRGLGNRRMSWICFTSAGVMYASVIASGSRAGAFIATLETLLLLVARVRLRPGPHPDRSPLRATAVIAMLVGIGGSIAGWGLVLERLSAKDLFAFRREFLISTLRMIQDRPWLGFGLGSWPWIYPHYAIIDPISVANHAHNDWVEWTSEGGLFFGALLAVIAARAIRLSIEMPWGIGAVAVFAHSAIDFPLQRPPLLLAVLLVLVAMEVEHSHREVHPTIERTLDGPAGALSLQST